MIYLYVKEVPTGLKYLGQTIKNPHKYHGSGTYWRNYLKKHAIKYDSIKTEILLETEDRELLKQKGVYYSKLWNIVESENWANLCIEMGDYGNLGHKQPQESIYRRVLKLRGRKKTQEEIERIRNSNKGKKRSLKTKEANRKANLGRIFSEEHKKKLSESSLKSTKKPKYKKGKSVINTETGEVYKSTRMLAKILEIPHETMRFRLNKGKSNPYIYVN